MPEVREVFHSRAIAGTEAGDTARIRAVEAAARADKLLDQGDMAGAEAGLAATG